jgi:SAM-dependent methyltransferase
MRPFVVMAGAAAAAEGLAIAGARTRCAPGESWRERFEFAAAGRPSGPLGWVYTRVMAIGHRPVYAMLAGYLDLQPDDDLLDVGCGSAGFLRYQAVHVRHVAGLDASAIQVGMARRRLAERITAGTAEIVLGDAAALPWEDGRFSVVTSLFSVEFHADSGRSLREMQRVLHPGGRAVLSLGWKGADASPSGTKDASGYWRWSEADARRLMEEAGFGEVSVSATAGGTSRLGILVSRAVGVTEVQLVRGIKPVVPMVAEIAEAPALVGEAAR